MTTRHRHARVHFFLPTASSHPTTGLRGMCLCTSVVVVAQQPLAACFPARSVAHTSPTRFRLCVVVAFKPAVACKITRSVTHTLPCGGVACLHGRTRISTGRIYLAQACVGIACFMHTIHERTSAIACGIYLTHAALRAFFGMAQLPQRTSAAACGVAHTLPTTSRQQVVITRLRRCASSTAQHITHTFSGVAVAYFIRSTRIVARRIGPAKTYGNIAHVPFLGLACSCATPISIHPPAGCVQHTQCPL
jgi:hypothetical protein